MTFTNNKRTRRTTKRIGIGASLLLWFIAISWIPLGTMGFIDYWQEEKVVAEEAEGLLSMAVTLKVKFIDTFFAERIKHIDTLALGKTTLAFLQQLHDGMQQTNTTGVEFVNSFQWSQLAEQYDADLKEFQQTYEYADIMLIDNSGNSLFSIANTSLLGVNIFRQPHSSTKFSKAAKMALAENRVMFSDLERSPFANNKIVGFLMRPVINAEGQQIGLVVLAVTTLPIKQILQDTTGLGTTGETFLIGTDLTMRTNPRADRNTDVLTTKVGTVTAGAWLQQEKTGSHVTRPTIQTYRNYQGHDVLGLVLNIVSLEKVDVHWAIVSEIATSEAFADLQTRRNQHILVIAITGVIVLLLAIFLSRHIVNPMIALTDWARNIAEGNLIRPAIATPDNELRALHASFSRVVDYLTQVIGQANAVADGDYTVEIRPRSADDVITSALMRMSQSLRKMVNDARTEDWEKTGRFQLSDCMREATDATSLAKATIGFLANYLDAQVGAIYIAQADNKLHLMGSYAYQIRKNLSNEFQFGEGVVGQAALEKTNILLTNVPSDHIQIQTGLGVSTPANILVYPIILNDTVKGVIELAALQGFTELQRTFLDQVSESIGMAIAAMESKRELHVMLERTQLQAEELEQQQMELTTTNTTLQQQTEALMLSEADLKQQQEELRVSNEELEQQAQALMEQKQDAENKSKMLQQAQLDIEHKAKDLEKANKYKSEFLANMSHELRTPLNSLLLLSKDFVENEVGNLSNEQIEDAKIIYSCGTDLLNLINELLDLSKIEAGQMTVNTDDLAISKFSQDLQRQFGRIADSKALHFAFETIDPLPEYIHTDVDKVTRILKNLLSNAFKFTKKGSITVRIYRPNSDATDMANGRFAANKTIAFSVIDTGIGIPQEKQELIFKAFHQADGTTSRQYGGTGLGLSISKELAKILGGDIFLESTPGKGCSFTLYLPELPQAKPAVAPSQTDDKQLAATTPRPAIVDKNKTQIDEKSLTSFILLIEDDPKFAQIIVKLAKKNGIECIVAKDGEAGLKLANKVGIIGIILDIGLPDINGWAVMDELKQNPKTCDIPIHIISAMDEGDQGLAKGAIWAYKKPVSKEQIEIAFKNLLCGSKAGCHNILVVEDDPNARTAMAKIFHNKDVTLTQVATAEAALDILTTKRFECVILDLGLPDMSGFDLLDQIAAERSTEKPQVIIYSGRDIATDEYERLKAHTDSIVIKGAQSEERLLDEMSLFLKRIDNPQPFKNQASAAMTIDEDCIFAGKTVLVVDDDIRNIYVITRQLERQGFHVHMATNGQKAVELLEAHPETDLIFMDIMMPVMDGYSAIKQIRSLAIWQDLPIVALTANAMPEDRDKCLAVGASDYLTKPLDQDRLVATLKTWLCRPSY